MVSMYLMGDSTTPEELLTEEELRNGPRSLGMHQLQDQSEWKGTMDAR